MTENDAELISATAEIIGRLVRAVDVGDMPAIAGELGALLLAVTKYTNAARPRDPALQRAVGYTWR